MLPAYRRPDDHLSDLALQQQAAGAGCALACAFSSSDEFYADIIDARRAAGAYGGRWYSTPAVAVAAAITLLAAVLFAL